MVFARNLHDLHEKLQALTRSIDDKIEATVDVTARLVTDTFMKTDANMNKMMAECMRQLALHDHAVHEKLSGLDRRLATDHEAG